MNEFELGWVVGFLEGEGSFHCQISRRINRPGRRPHDQYDLKIEACQVQREPLERLHRYTGVGNIVPKRDRRRPASTLHEWTIWGSKAFTLMTILRPFLSPRRQMQVDTAIGRYESRPRENRSETRRRAWVTRHAQRTNDPRQLRIIPNA